MKKSEIAVSISLIFVDYLMVVLAGIFAYSLRYLSFVQQIRPVVFDLRFAEFLNFLWPVALIWPAGFVLAGLYSMKGTRRGIDEMAKIVLGCSTAVMILMFVFFFSRSLFDSRFIVIAAWVLSVVLVIFGRGVVRFFQRFCYRFGLGVHRVIIIGRGELAREVGEVFKKNRRAGYRLVKNFDDFSRKVEEELVKLKQKDKFDEILVVTPNLSASQVNRLNDFSYVNHVILKFIADIFDFPINNFKINTIDGLPIVELQKTSLDGWGRVCKRIFDIFFSLIFIILTSPVMILAALAVKLSSPGSLFFSYRRIGQFGRPFRYFKFRSMIKDAHQYRFNQEFLKKHSNLRKDGPMMKFQNDPRVTPVGQLLRRFSVDELPELFNVLIGRMSLVGPRPHEIEEVEKYQSHHQKVLTIKPGMTGMAQVSGRADLDFEEEIRLDTWYMENWSPKLDLMILLKTPLAIFKKTKA